MISFLNLISGYFSSAIVCSQISQSAFSHWSTDPLLFGSKITVEIYFSPFKSPYIFIAYIGLIFVKQNKHSWLRIKSETIKQFETCHYISYFMFFKQVNWILPYWANQLFGLQDMKLSGWVNRRLKQGMDSIDSHLSEGSCLVHTQWEST